MAESRQCSVSGCGNPHRTRGFCSRHYQQWRSGSHPELQPQDLGVPEGRTCTQCGAPIPLRRRSNASYCSADCKRRAMHRRQYEAPARRLTECSVDGCASAVFARGICSKHYTRLRTKGTVDDRRVNARGTCTVDGCRRPHVARGLCELHRDRERRAQEQTARLAARTDRTCLSCGGPLRPEQPSNTTFCSRRCKDRERVASGRAADAATRSYFRSQYDLTPEQVDEMAEEGCAICGTTDWNGRHGRPHVDHDHKTGKVRGVLCDAHNLGLGKFGDDPELLRRAADYIEKHRLDLTP